jgi:hypothetical protein
LHEAVAKIARARKENPPNVTAELDSSIKQIRLELRASPTEWEHYFAVGGIDSAELPATFGGVYFFLADSTGLHEYLRSAAEIRAIDQIGESDPITARAFRRQFANRVIARLRVSAIDHHAAHQRALKVLRGTVDCMNFFVADKMRVTVDSDVASGPRLYPAIRLTNQKEMTVSRQSSLRKASLIDLAKHPGFLAVSDVLRKGSLSDLEDRIITAVRWAGRARVDERREESFLFFAVALETLLLGDQTTDLQYKLRLRCAHLVASESLESRKLVSGQVVKLYRTRSKIVHTGIFDVTDNELYLIQRYARGAILVLLSREPFKSMPSASQLEDWFESMALSTPI